VKRKGLLVGGSLILAIALSGGSVAWASIPRGPEDGAFSKGVGGDVGVAGPLGPQGFAGIASYFKRVTFTFEELGQPQEIAAHLPAGRYLVELLALNAPAHSPDCAGVSFPLVPAADVSMGYTGYATVANDGDATTVSCYERADDPAVSATYELFYIPATG